MTQEIGRTWNVSEEAKKRWEETNERIRKSKQMYVERARQLGESLGATLVAITGFPPGARSDPAVYRSKHDESYFMVAGKKGEVATYNDPEEIRKSAKRLYRVPLDFVQAEDGEYAIVRFDFKRRIEEGGLFYTPEGYLEGRRHDLKFDPPPSPPGCSLEPPCGHSS
jgi:hypothetical protein